MSAVEPAFLQHPEYEELLAHVWDDDQHWAIQAALAANRPLLVRGEPGIGKTQLAQAAAEQLRRPLVSLTVDSNTESRDLMWTFDAVARLAEAQVAANLYSDRDELRASIDVKHFISPGPIWWAIDWDSAEAQLRPGQHAPVVPKGWQTANGVVILIDEIDKADSDVPNGLLEAFGSRQFTPQGWSSPISIRAGIQPPLIVVTTNEERVLPDAFVRRCFVLHLQLPDCVQPDGEDLQDDERDKFLSYLITRGKAHFGELIPAEQLLLAAELLMNDRKEAILQNQSPRPGQAEYLDFLRALIQLASQRKGDRKQVYADICKNISRFVFKKSRGTDL